MQAFADRAADDFGITQREVLERTGLRINAENAPRTFDDGSRINENGELVGSDGRVLFQRVGRNGATDEELRALERANKVYGISQHVSAKQQDKAVRKFTVFYYQIPGRNQHRKICNCGKNNLDQPHSCRRPQKNKRNYKYNCCLNIF